MINFIAVGMLSLVSTGYFIYDEFCNIKVDNFQDNFINIEIENEY